MGNFTTVSKLRENRFYGLTFTELLFVTDWFFAAESEQVFGKRGSRLPPSEVICKEPAVLCDHPSTLSLQCILEMTKKMWMFDVFKHFYSLTHVVGRDWTFKWYFCPKALWNSKGISLQFQNSKLQLMWLKLWGTIRDCHHIRSWCRRLQ